MVSEYDAGFTDEHVYTTDPEAIRQWAEARDAIPVDVGRERESDDDAEEGTDGDAGTPGSGGVDDYRFVRRDDHEVGDVEASWRSFFAAFEQADRALVLGADPGETGTDGTGTDGTEIDREDEEIATHEFHPREALADSPAGTLEDRQPPSEDS